MVVVVTGDAGGGDSASSPFTETNQVASVDSQQPISERHYFRRTRSITIEPIL